MLDATQTDNPGYLLFRAHTADVASGNARILNMAWIGNALNIVKVVKVHCINLIKLTD